MKEALTTLSNQLIEWSQNSPISVECYIERDKSELNITLITVRQCELQVTLRKSYFCKERVLLVLIRNIDKWEKVTRVYLKMDKDNKFKILRLVKGGKEYSALRFILRRFDYDMYCNFLFQHHKRC